MWMMELERLKLEALDSFPHYIRFISHITSVKMFDGSNYNLAGKGALDGSSVRMSSIEVGPQSGQQYSSLLRTMLV